MYCSNCTMSINLSGNVVRYTPVEILVSTLADDKKYIVTPSATGSALPRGVYVAFHHHSENAF